MVRPYAIKGKKRKTREEKYDREEDEEVEVEEKESANRGSIEKPKGEAPDEEEEEDESGAHELVGIPIAPSDQNTKKAGVIFVLEKASLEVAKVGKSFQLLNSDDHANFLRKNKKNPAYCRPDIAHQALLAILDSPINKAGRLQAVYVKTEKGVLFEVKPHVRIPRTYKRFSGIMLQLLQQHKITAVGKRESLLRLIKNPVTQYFPVNSRKIGFSYSSEKLVKMSKYVDAVDDDVNLVFVVGAMAHGKIGTEYVDDFIAISGYPLSAAMCIARITEALAEKWNVL
ncbi:ribosomal RNA small subunit methyltransferase NEP1 [Herrania umbratica]|uniref:Ribosomal RNA small subunit methyltransferase NEP1 n=1 Tax=Herrania umbratica TaxID=108875 RepID=A0A6J1A4Z7_9ROSI|nr:ribosomal RNA small subunit methyltransferase NEP1 [Herrania umbratica]XP_021282197.1 ribosomal RNA small subunit methyltransferase NEP1 [Herrania umbratica]